MYHPEIEYFFELLGFGNVTKILESSRPLCKSGSLNRKICDVVAALLLANPKMSKESVYTAVNTIFE